MKQKILWGAIYIGVFVLSAVAGFPLINPLVTGDGGVSKVVWNEQVGTIKTDIAYGTGEFQKLDLYLPPKNQQTYGLVVYIHGGGFTGGDKAGDAPILKWATARGYVAAGINYTLHDKNRPNSTIYDMSQDIKQGVAVAVEHAKQQGYLIDKMAIGGGSAGSLLAMIYGYRDSETSPVPVAFIFQAAGPTLTVPQDFGVSNDLKSAESLAFFNEFLGVGVTADDVKNENYLNKIKQVSPSLQVGVHSPPLLFAHGKLDKIVIYRQAEHLLDALNKTGAKYEFIEFEKSGHNMGWQKDKMQAFMDKLDEYLKTYMPIKQ